MSKDDPIFKLLYILRRTREVEEANEGKNRSREFIETFRKTGINKKGEVVTEKNIRVAPLDCGCNPSVSPLAGRCAACLAYICENHYYRCAADGCGRPLCPSCKFTFEENVFCEECAKEAKAKARIKKVTGFFFGSKS